MLNKKLTVPTQSKSCAWPIEAPLICNKRIVTISTKSYAVLEPRRASALTEQGDQLILAERAHRRERIARSLLQIAQRHRCPGCLRWRRVQFYRG